MRNAKSIHDRRVDVIFSLDKPEKVRARTLNTRPRNKTPSLPWFPDRLWPSDHATVVAKLWFDEDDADENDDDDDENEDDDD